jgi:Concanavalin A-like lectin/glucanases superfamily/Immunoglobulin I-set domain/Cohesin domain
VSYVHKRASDSIGARTRRATVWLLTLGDPNNPKLMKRFTRILGWCSTLVFIVVCLMPVSIKSQGTGCVPAPSGLVSWWRGEGDGSDRLGANNASSITGVSYTNGVVGRAFEFNGVDGRIIVPDALSLNFSKGQNFSIEAWLRTADQGGAFGVMVLVDKRLAGSVGYVFCLNNGRLDLRLSDSGSGIDYTAPEPDVRDGRYHHVAVTVDRSSTTGGKYYLDGQPIYTFDPTGVSGDLSNSDTLKIGMNSDPAYSMFYGGEIDELSIYRQALSPLEVLSIYNAGSSGKCTAPAPPSILVQPADQSVLVSANAFFTVGAVGTGPLSFQWMFNGNALPGATDSSLALTSVKPDQAGVYSVQVTNVYGSILSSNAVLTVLMPPPCVPPPGDIAAWWRGEDNAFDSAFTNNASEVLGVSYVDGLVGKAFAFDGVNGHILVPDAPSFNFGSNQNFSIETWMNTTDQGGAYATLVLVDKRLAGSVGLVFYLINGRPGLRVSPANGPSQAFSAPDPDLRDGKYHHVAVSVDRTSTTGGKIYVDGQAVYTFDPTTVNGDLSNSDSLRIGMNSDSAYSMFYGGILDELSIYRRVLSASEVAAIYSAGSGGKCFTPTPPMIIKEPGDLAAYLGLSATLAVAAAGSPPLSYQWMFGGQELTNATNASLVLNSVTASQAGDYAVVIRNAYGSVTSATAHVTVSLQPPYIVTHPQNVTVMVGQDAVFSILASGSPPLSYQWLFKGVPLDGATSSRLLLSKVSFDQAGAYSVVVTNDAGSVTSSNATLRVNFPPASIRVVSTSGQSGHTLVVPISVVANGNENALAFSLNFNRTLLSFAGATVGPGAPGAALLINDSQTNFGRVGLALGLGAGTALAPGTQQVVQVSFTPAILTTPNITTISFGDLPLARQLADSNGGLLPANYFSGLISLTAADFEADLSPRPNGNKIVDISDWVLAGRYAARLDYPTNASEFQRADCAPRATAGDGAITVTDWVQAGRYAAKLDPLTVAGGPTNEGGLMLSRPKDNFPRQVRVADTWLLASQTGTVRVLLEAQGNENALGFSISFDPGQLTFQSATTGAAVPGALFNLNAQSASSGTLGFVLAMPSGSSIPAGTREVLKVTFRAADSTGSGSVALTDQPVKREVSDPLATVLDTTYVNGALNIMGPPQLGIAPAQGGVLLTWPAWATNFVVQTAGTPNSVPALWTNLVTLVTLTNGLQQATIPASATEQYYRLLEAP